MSMEPVTLRPERMTLAVVLVMALGSLPLALSSPYLAPLLLVPITALVWVLRARVVADADHLEVCNGLQVRRIVWADVEGFTVHDRGGVSLLRREARPVRLMTVNRHELPRLLAVSQPTP